MTILREALEMTPKRLLLIIARRRGLRLSSGRLKSDLVDQLARVLSDRSDLDIAVTGLTASERRALTAVLAAGGRVPLRYLRPRHGGFHSVRWLVQRFSRSPKGSKRDAASLSPLEQLRILGLIFYDAKNDDVFIPTDLIPHLPTPVPSPQPEGPDLGVESSAGTHPSPVPADLVCHDLAVLLGLLQRDDVRLLAGGWLPPRFLAAWGQHCVVPPASPKARSELRTGRRRFLHYLAEAAGFVALSGPFLKPTPSAWTWLQAPRADRFRVLWEAWATPDPERWRAFRLPGARWLSRPIALLTAIHAHLGEMDPSDPQVFAQALLSCQPQLYELAAVESSGDDESLARTIAQILSGPLVWMGSGAFAVGSKAYGSERDVLPFVRFAVSADIQPDPLDSTLTLTLASGLPEPAHLAVVLVIGRTDSERGVRNGEAPPTSYSLLPTSYSLSPTSFINALHRGWSAPALLDALDRLAKRPLTGQERALLRAWAEAADRVTISRPTVLETIDSAVISRLASTRRGRLLIVRTLSPRAVVVDEGRLDQLVRRLTRQEGFPPRVELPPSRGGRICDEKQVDLGRAGAAHAWLALRVYQGLGKLVRLPARTPQVLLDQLAASADPADLSAAETAASATLDALQEVVIGRAIFPPWPEAGLPVEESLAVIEEALAEGQALEIDYYTAGRDVLTHRVVEPYRLEWRGPSTSSGQGIPYLVGFCHRVQSERVFRLDRIYSVVKVQGRMKKYLSSSNEPSEML